MIMHMVYSFFKDAVFLYRSQFLKIFSLGFFLSCAAGAALFALLYSPFDMWDVLLWKNIINFNLDEKIALAVAQKPYFPIMAAYKLGMLKLGAVSPIMIRIYYWLLLIVTNIIFIGFIKSLCMVYDRQHVSLADLFFSYKAVLRTFFILIGTAVVAACASSSMVTSALWADYLFKESFIGDVCQYALQFLVLFFAVWFVSIFIIIVYGAITTEDSLFSVLRKGCCLSLQELFLVIITFGMLAAVLCCFAFLIDVLIVPSCSINQLVLITFLKNTTILPVSVFVLYGLYKKVQESAVY